MVSSAISRPAILSRARRLGLMATLPLTEYSTWAGEWPARLAAQQAVRRCPWAYPDRSARAGDTSHRPGNTPPHHRVRPATPWHQSQPAPDTAPAPVPLWLAPGRSV